MANTRSRRARECRVASIGLVIGLVLIAPVQPALAEERCGWLENPAPDRFVATNGHYGYSCACVSGTFDDHAERMTRVDATRALPLSVCRIDKALPAPGGSP
jgi:hypothetical protein